jgi:hypothetical protein
MFDNRDRRRRRILVVREPSLQALVCIVGRAEIAAEAAHCRRVSDPEPSLVHHVEHVGEPLARLADQRRERVAAFGEIEQAVDCAALAHLMVETRECDVVPRAERSVRFDSVAGRKKKRNALHPRRASRNFREHHVDNIVRKAALASDGISTRRSTNFGSFASSRPAMGRMLAR